jgi:hypothetical protein
MREVTYNILVVASEGKGQLGRPRCKWEYNIKKILGKWYWSVWNDFI